MTDDIKLPVFKGTGSEDPEQFWFLCEAVWTAKNILDQDIRRAQLVTSFRDRALTWFMNFSSTQNDVLADNKEWFIAALLPHIRSPLMQQKVADQQEALEIMMKLETAPIEDNSGIAQIQAQLAAMALELRDMKKRKNQS